MKAPACLPKLQRMAAGLALSTAASTQVSAFDHFDGYASLGARLVDLRPTALVPDPEAAGYAEQHFDGRAVIAFGYGGGVRLSGQTRLLYDSAPEPRGGHSKTKVEIDELYIEGRVSDTLLLFGGRRNMSAGQSLGINPADVFLDAGEKDRSLASERQRAELNGIDMIGADAYFPDGGSVQAYWAPATESLNDGRPDRAYLAYSMVFGASSADATVFAFNESDRPGVGLSLVIPINSGFLAYADTAVQKGESLPQVAEAGAISPLGADAEGVSATVGLSHPFAGDASLNVEYTHLSGGYSAKEWRNYLAALDTNSPAASPVQGAALARLGKIAEASYLRRNYLFARLHHPDIMASGVETEITALAGADDGSGSIGLRIGIPIGNNAALRMNLVRTYGESEDEFVRGVKASQTSIAIEVEF